MGNKKSIWKSWAGQIFKIAVSAAFPLLLIMVWQILSDRNMVSQSVFPGPRRIAQGFAGLIIKGTYSRHVLASLSRVLRGYVLGCIGGLTIGTLAALSPWINQSILALVGIFRPIPAIAYIPLLILWLGIGEESKVAVITIGSFWPVLLNTIHGIKSTDPKLMEVGKVFEKNYGQMLWKIVLPQAMPSIFTGLRLGISSAWTCVVTSEMIAASRGIGFLISYGRELAQPNLMFVGIASIGIIGLIIDTVVLHLQQRVIYWTDK
ncbi:ABC transporter permease [Spirochaetia bacterium]|nr:ABC transporter permease [Spirochaetia bacterium]